MAANFYYSSESSDSENSAERLSLDFSYLMLDSDSLVVHLRNSVREQNLIQAVKSGVVRRSEGVRKQEGKEALKDAGYTEQRDNTNNEDENGIREQRAIQVVKSGVVRRSEGVGKPEGIEALKDAGNYKEQTDNTNNEELIGDENELLNSGTSDLRKETEIVFEETGNTDKGQIREENPISNSQTHEEENASLLSSKTNYFKGEMGLPEETEKTKKEVTREEENASLSLNTEDSESETDYRSYVEREGWKGDVYFEGETTHKSLESYYTEEEMRKFEFTEDLTHSKQETGGGYVEKVEGKDEVMYFEEETLNKSSESYNTEEETRKFEVGEEREVSQSYVQRKEKEKGVHFEAEETHYNSLETYNTEEETREFEFGERKVSRSYVQESEEEFDSEDEYTDEVTQKLLLQHNMLLTLPYEITKFRNLLTLDLSNNNLSHINDFILSLPELRSLYLQNNNLSDDGLPKDLSALTKLRELNLSGNKLTRVLPQLSELVQLKYLYLGGNEITEILPEIKALQSLQVLHLGGNLLETVPDELGELHQLAVLILCDNRLRYLPRVISNLTRLRSLLLHKNNLCCLPVCIVKLRGLAEVSLRDNPLVTRFVNSCARNIMYNTPSLLELAARVIKLKKLTYTREDLPLNLHAYLSSGQRCVNPKCKGMYFTSCVEHIKFVDFCGMYRVPLMHYLCSSRCSSKTPDYYRAQSESDSEEDEPAARLKRVLLG